MMKATQYTFKNGDMSDIQIWIDDESPNPIPVFGMYSPENGNHFFITLEALKSAVQCAQELLRSKREEEFQNSEQEPVAWLGSHGFIYKKKTNAPSGIALTPLYPHPAQTKDKA